MSSNLWPITLSQVRYASNGCSGIPDDIFVFEFLQKTDLANGGARHALVFSFQAYLLQSHDLVGGDIACFVDDAVSACA